MRAANSNELPPVLAASQPKTKGAPTLYAIIGFKLLKGAALVLVALAFYAIPHGDLKTQLADSFRDVPLDAKSAAELSGWLELITPESMRVVAVGSVLYGLFSWVEGAGLLLRASWGAWLVIWESALFVPMEVWQLYRSYSFSMFVILVLNIAIVWYLYANRRRLFYSR